MPVRPVTGTPLESYKDEASVPLSLGSGQQDVGKRVKASKRRFFWQFMFGPHSKPHKLELLVSVLSGKRTIHLDGAEVYAGNSNVADFSFTVTIGTHVAKIEARGEDVQCSVDFVDFDDLRPRDSVAADEADAMDLQASRDAQARLRASMRGSSVVHAAEVSRSTATTRTRSSSWGPPKADDVDLLSFDTVDASEPTRRSGESRRELDDDDDPFAELVASTSQPALSQRPDPFASLSLAEPPSRQAPQPPPSYYETSSRQPVPSAASYYAAYSNSYYAAAQPPLPANAAADATAARAQPAFDLFDRPSPPRQQSGYYY